MAETFVIQFWTESNYLSLIVLPLSQHPFILHFQCGPKAPKTSISTLYHWGDYCNSLSPCLSRAFCLCVIDRGKIAVGAQWCDRIADDIHTHSTLNCTPMLLCCCEPISIVSWRSSWLEDKNPNLIVQVKEFWHHPVQSIVKSDLLVMIRCYKAHL